jgi:ATP-dependent DNA ligase
VLYLNGQDLRNSPLIERKRILRGIVPRNDSNDVGSLNGESKPVPLLLDVVDPTIAFRP